MVSLITIGIAVFIISISYYFLQKKRKGFPPGPWGLPIIGNLLSLDSQLFPTFERWGKQYGPVVSVKLGNVQAIILDDLKVIREALNHKGVAGRPDTKILNFFSDGKHGISNSEGKEWQEQRRFAIRTLRDFGFGRKSMECLIMDEVSDVMKWVNKTEGTPVSVNQKFSLAGSNALMTIMTGKRYEQDDPVLKNLLDSATNNFREAAKSGAVWFFPQLSVFFPKFFGYDKFVQASNKLITFFQNIADEQMAHTSGEVNSTNFSQAYLKEIENTSDPESSFYQEKGRKYLPIVLLDLYFAGSATTYTTLAWIILYLLKHPQVQTKLQKELNEVTGGSRCPCLADRPRTPYAEAIVQETLRFSSLVPWGLFHNTLEEVELGGFRIPKDTLIIPNLHAVHYNPDIWGDPENFRPERFLSEDGNGKTVKRNDALLAFSAGKRVCIGEALARDQVYLFMTNILSKYQVLPDPADSEPSLVPVGAFALEPQPFTVVFKERQN